MSPVGRGVGSGLSRICCCSSFPRVISCYSPPQAHPACFADAQQLTGTERRRLKGEPGCDWPQETGVMSVSRLMETESVTRIKYLYALKSIFSFFVSRRAQFKPKRQRAETERRGSGLRRESALSGLGVALTRRYYILSLKIRPSFSFLFFSFFLFRPRRLA